MIQRERRLADTVALPSLANHCFRANPDYRLLHDTQLTREQREVFAGLADDPDHAGYLIPVSCVQNGVKVVNSDLAALFDLLKVPRRLSPSLVVGGRSCDPDDHVFCARVASLVLDGVLQIEVSGTFLHGLCARDYLCIGPVDDAPSDRIAEVSREALLLSHHVPTDDPTVLSWWLYGYNTLPLGPSWQRRFGRGNRYRQILGLEETGHNRRTLAGDYFLSTNSSWMSWRNQTHLADSGTDRLGYKLYVSLQINDLVESFRSIVDVLIDERVPAFKLGCAQHGLSRPDKFVVYFETWESLRSTATRLQLVLQGVAAQAVPFTSSLTPDGLLSWGMDPPSTAQLKGWGVAESWRIWLTNQLARAQICARASGASAEDSLSFACARLHLQGVDWSSPAFVDTGLCGMSRSCNIISVLDRGQVVNR